MKKLRQQNLSFKDNGSREFNLRPSNIKLTPTMKAKKNKGNATIQSHHLLVMGTNRKADA